MAQEVATAVLRDFAYLVWLTLIFGLVGSAVWRFFSSRRPAAEEGSGKGRRDHGVPTEHFTGADLVVLPMVLTKYSIVLVLAAVFLFSLPGRFFVWLGMEPEKAAGESGVESQTNETFEMTPHLMGYDFLLNFILVSLVVVMIQWVGRADPAEVFGLRRWKPWKLLLWIAAGSAVAIPLVKTMAGVSAYGIHMIFGKSLEEQVAVQSLREANEQPLMQFLLIVNACVVAPIVEEVIFRGYLYGVLKRFTGAMFAGFVGASLFAVAHDTLPTLLPLWGFALLLTLFYEASRSLWVPIGMHAVFNGYNVYELLYNSGG